MRGRVSEITLVYFEDMDEYFHFTFEFQISITRWVNIDDDHRERKKSKQVHAVFVRLHKISSIVSVGYNGFENQAHKSDPSRISYEQIVTDVLNALTEMGVSTSTLPVRKAIDFLIERNSTRIYREKGDPEFNFGKLTVQGKHGSGIEEVLARIFDRTSIKIDQRELVKAAKEALASSSMNSVLAVWKEEKLVSRIEFWDIGAEFLFVWRRTPQTYARCFEVFGLIRDVLRSFEGANSLGSVLDSFQIGQVFRAADIANSIEIRLEDLKNLLIEAVKLGLIVPAYRLRTQLIVQDQPNEWTENLSPLGRSFSLEDGSVLNGKDPKNIEIGFLKPKVGKELRSAEIAG